MQLQYPARLLSDLHLGHEVSTIEDCRQLAPLLEGIATLILNGDTLEARLPNFREKSHRMLAGLQEMAAARNITMVMLNGNHDPSQWPLDWLELAGGATFITHGHVFLDMVSPWSAKLRKCRSAMEAIAAEYTSDALREMETRYERTRRWSETMIATEVRQGGRGLGAKIAMALRELWPPSRPWNVAKVWTLLPFIAQKFINEFRPHAKVVLFGHTHRAAWWRKNGRLLVNTGGFISFASPLAIDFPNESSVELRRIDLKDGRFVLGKMVEREDLGSAGIPGG